MITRPLDLAARLRPLSKGWDGIFYVNVCALGLFFAVFGSRYVLAPGLAVDFALPKANATATSTRTTDVVIAVPSAGVAVVNGAVLDFPGLSAWMREQTAKETEPVRLLVQASASLPVGDLAEIYALAESAGFVGVLFATDGTGTEGVAPH